MLLEKNGYRNEKLNALVQVNFTQTSSDGRTADGKDSSNGRACMGIVKLWEMAVMANG